MASSKARLPQGRRRANRIAENARRKTILAAFGPFWPGISHEGMSHRKRATMKTTSLSSWRAIVLIALAFQLSSVYSHAEIILGDRRTLATARAFSGSDPGPGDDAEIDTYELADFRVTADAGGDKGEGTVKAEVVHDSRADTLTVTHNSFDSAFGDGTPADTKQGSCQTFTELSFDLTDVSYTYTIAETATIVTNGAFFEHISASVDLLSAATGLHISAGTGTLPPGHYHLLIGDVAVSNHTPASSINHHAEFKLAPIGKTTPPPPPAGLQWTNTAGGSFNVVTNWKSKTIPRSIDTAIFDPAAAYTVDVGTAHSDRLVIRNGNVTFTNMAYTVGSTTFDPASLVLNNAKLTLASGQLNSGPALIGERAASRLDVSANATWISTGSVRVGGPGNGFLAIAAGGTVISAESRIGTGIGGGDVFIGGTNAKWTTGNCAVGFGGAGTLTIDGGAEVESDDSFVGRNPGSSGQVLVQDIDVNGKAALWNLPDHTLVVGGDGFGELQILSGASVYAGKLILRQHSAGGGVIVIAGAPGGANPIRSAMLLFDTAFIDDSMRIEQGGAAIALNTDFIIGFAFDGDVTVHGLAPVGALASRLEGVGDLTVGLSATGKLTVDLGGLAECKNGFIAKSAGSVGNVTVDGSGNGVASEWTLSRDLTVAQSGEGNLQITNGGKVTANLTQIGAEPGSVGSVSVSGRSSLGPSFFTANDHLNVGFGGRGALTVSLGGRVAVTGPLIMDSEETFQSDMTVGGSDPATGLGSVISVNGNVLLGSGEFSNSRMVITEDGTVLCHDATIGGIPGSFSTVEVGVRNGTGVVAQFNVSGDLTVGEEGHGILILRNSANVTVGGTLFVGRHGAIFGNGTLSAATRIIIKGGSVQAGLSPGRLTFNGDFELSEAGVLVMQIGGTTPGTTHDQLVINGNASLGGKLLMKFMGGFAPKMGDHFELLDISGATTGGFSEVEVEGLIPGFQFSTESNGNGQIVLTALTDGTPLPAKGIFRGRLQGDPEGPNSSGFFTIQITAGDGFTARFVLGGRNFAINGKFDPSGQFSKTIPRKGRSPLIINLELDTAGGDRSISGTIFDGELRISVSADVANTFDAKINPAPQAGQYTVLLQFDPARSEVPRANGIGTVAVSKSGAIRFAGVLADGTRLTQGTTLSRSGEWPLYVSLYKNQGAVLGDLKFRDQPGSDFDGNLRWARPKKSTDKFLTTGFYTNLPVIGSKYLTAPAVPTVLELPAGATTTLSDTDLNPALTKSLTLNPKNRFMVLDPGTDKFSLSATTATGLLSAHFTHPKTHLSTAVRGVVLQKQNLGSGFFLRRGTIGSFEIQANP